MDQQQAFYEILLQKGLSQESAKEVLAWLEASQPAYNFPTPINGRSAQDWITALFKEPEVVRLMHAAIQREEKLTELENADEKEFQGFLTRLDYRQKVYNLIFMALGCAIILGLKSMDVVSKETASTLITIIITATLTDAITNFYKSKDKE